MKKLLSLALVLSFTVPCYANPSADFKPSPSNPNLQRNSVVVIDKEVDGADAFIDMPLRIAGFSGNGSGNRGFCRGFAYRWFDGYVSTA